MRGERKAMLTIPVSDLKAARRFYEETLGQRVASELGDHALLWEAGFFTYATAENAGSSPATLGGWEVGDIEAAVADLREGGLAFEEYDFPGLKTEDGIAELEGERAAWFTDPDGNILTIFELTG